MKLVKKLFAGLLTLVLLLTIIPSKFTVQAATLKKTEEQLKADIAKFSVTVTVNNQNQRFAIKKSDISKFNVRSTKYNKKKTQATVKSYIYINRDVATIKGNVTSVYKYKGKKWKLASVTYTKTSLYSFDPRGTWNGTYTAGQGETKITIEIPDVTADGFFIDGKVYFSALPTNPTVPSGSFSLIGGYDLTSGKINFSGNQWIEQPDGYSMINFDAYIDLVNKQITGTNQLVLKK